MWGNRLIIISIIIVLIIHSFRVILFHHILLSIAIRWSCVLREWICRNLLYWVNRLKSSATRLWHIRWVYFWMIVSELFRKSFFAIRNWRLRCFVLVGYFFDLFVLVNGKLNVLWFNHSFKWTDRKAEKGETFFQQWIQCEMVVIWLMLLRLSEVDEFSNQV